MLDELAAQMAYLLRRLEALENKVEQLADACERNTQAFNRLALRLPKEERWTDTAPAAAKKRRTRS